MKTHLNVLTRVAAVAARAVLAAIVFVVWTDRALAQTTPPAAAPPTPTPAAQASTPSNPPTGTVDVGVGDVSSGSFKAGEYNGLETKGLFGIGNLDVRDGTPYGSASAFRWRIKGTDLGLATRTVFAQVAVQGKFRFRFSYDGLLRNRSDSYQTPYNGAGTSTLMLPSTWLVPTVAATGGANAVSARGLVTAIGDAPYLTAGALVTPTSAQTALVNAAASADVPLFHTVDLATTRHRYDAAFNLILNPQWTFDAEFKPEHKDGLKPMGTVTENTGSLISTVIPVLIDNDTNQISLNLTFKGQKTFAQAGYYGSFFKNDATSMSWQNWATSTGTTNTITTEPSNNFNQFSATGGVNLSPTTKLVANGSYAVNTQNDAYITNPTEPVVPVNSLNGRVVSTAFNAKFTTRPTKKLNLTAAYKYDNRDNQTAINIYQYADAEAAPVANVSFPAGSTNALGAVLAQNANANRPYSKRVNQFTFNADYAVAKGQWIKAGYDFEAIDRSCPGAWIACADAPVTHERTLRAEWRTNLSSALAARVSYANSARTVPAYNENAFLALVPYANVIPVGATMSALQAMNLYGLAGYGPVLGYNGGVFVDNFFFPSNNALPNTLYANNNRISELPGMERYYVADRNRDKVRTLLSWQASDQISVQGGVDLTRDNYPDSIYGLQHAKGWAANLDGTYTPTDTLSVNVFYTHDNQQSTSAGNTYTANSNASTITNGQAAVTSLSGNSCDSYTTLQQRNNNNKLDPCLNWFANMLDRANTLGLGMSKKAENLELTGNFSLTRARWDNNVIGGNWANNLLDGTAAPPATIIAYFIAATPLPTVVTNSAELRLNAKYALGHGQSLRVAYAYLRMRSNDFAYDGMQFGTLSAQLPTNEQPFNYGVHVIGVSYVVVF